MLTRSKTNWQPMTDEDWEWVNHGKLPNQPKPVDIPKI